MAAATRSSSADSFMNAALELRDPLRYARQRSVSAATFGFSGESGTRRLSERPPSVNGGTLCYWRPCQPRMP